MRSTPVNSINASALAASISSQQHQIDALQAGFAAQASNSNFLAAMTVASNAFSLGRTLGASLFSGVLRGAALQGSAFSVGFAAEILSFRGANQILTPGSESWLNASGLASTATDFLMMKGAGVFCGTSSYGVRQLVQASAMVGGEYAGESMGVRERSGQAFSARFAHALATGVAMDAGGVLARVGSAGRMESVQRNLEHQTSTRVRAAESRVVQDQALQSSFSQMAANRQTGAAHLAGLVREAGVSASAAEALLVNARSAASSFVSEHLDPMIEVARSVPKVAEALVFVAFENAGIFEATHLAKIIEVGKTQFMLRKALFPLAMHRSRLFTPKNLTEILAYPEHPDTTVEDVVRYLQEKRGLKFFIRDHVRGLIALAGTRQETPALLDALTKERPKLFQPKDLPALAEALARNYRVVTSFNRVLTRTHEAKALSWDLFMAMVRVDEAHYVQTGSERSVLAGFAREHFDYFTPKRIVAIIEAAKTQRVAAGILQNLVGIVSSDTLRIAPMHPGLSSEHVPGIIEAAISQGPAADALAALVDWRRDRAIVEVEHYPAIIAAAGKNPRVGNALLPLVLSRSIKATFTPEHLAQMLAVARTSEPVVQAIHTLVVNRADLAGAVPVAEVLALAQARPSSFRILNHFAKDRPRVFGADHFSPMIDIAKQNSDVIEGVIHLFEARPEMLTPATLVEVVDLLSQDRSEKGETQRSALLRCCANRDFNFTADYVQPLVDQAPSHPLALSLLTQIINRHPEYYTREQLQSLIEAAQHHGDWTSLGVVSGLLKHRPDLFIGDDLPTLLAIVGGRVDLPGAVLLGGLVDNPTLLASFSGEHIPVLLAVAEGNKQAMKNLSRLVAARPDLFDTQTTLMRLFQITVRHLG